MAFAARACVSEIFPPPISPTLIYRELHIFEMRTHDTSSLGHGTAFATQIRKSHRMKIGLPDLTAENWSFFQAGQLSKSGQPGHSPRDTFPIYCKSSIPILLV